MITILNGLLEGSAHLGELALMIGVLFITFIASAGATLWMVLAILFLIAELKGIWK